MGIYLALNIVVAIIVVLAVIYILYRLFVWKQGNENVMLIVKRRTPFLVESKDFNSVTLYTDIPFTNKGTQLGTIMDLFPRHLLPCEQFDGVTVTSWGQHLDRTDRQDGYFESYIVKPKTGGTVRIHVTFTGLNGNIMNDIQGLPDMNIDIYYQVVGRTYYRITKQRIRMTEEEVARALAQ